MSSDGWGKADVHRDRTSNASNKRHFIKWNGMGQKGSKSKGSSATKPKSLGPGCSSPLNNATYWEAEEDPEWDNCVMVVATQQARRRQQLTSACSQDSLARSLHKEVEYSPLNVSRRSPDYQWTTLGPDSRYPNTTSHRKRQNTLLDTGWHACFKNNNYVFVRNTNEGQEGDKWKDNNESDVTFIISTSKTGDEEKDEKLVVSLHDHKPKVRKFTTPTPPSKKQQNNTLPRTLKTRDTGSSGSIRHKRSDKKKSPSWLKKLKSPGRNRSKKDASAEEATLILGTASDESPESGETTSFPSLIHDSEFYPPTKKSFERAAGQLKESLPTKTDTPILQSELTLQGPQTSTPKDKFLSDSLKNACKRSGTPYRPIDTRLSVRRRLPYENMTPEEEETSPVLSPHRESQLSLLDEDLGASPKLDMPLSPIKKANVHQHPNQVSSDPDISASVNRLQRRVSCFQSRETPKVKSCSALQRRSSCIPSRNLQESLEKAMRKSEPVTRQDLILVPTAGNLLHPSSSNNDIPFVDCEVDVSFDERRDRKLSKNKPYKSANDISLNVDEYVEGEYNEMEVASVPQLKYEISVTPQKQSTSSSRLEDGIESPISLKVTPLSPMEREENMSLDQHAKHMLSPDDSTVTFSPYTPLKTRSNENPISCWLKEIRILTDSECLNALQAKELQKEDWVPNALAVGNAQETSEKIWELGTTIQIHVDEMLECLKSEKASTAPLSLKVAQFCSYVVELLKMTTTIKQVSQAEAKIRKACAELLANVNKNNTGKDWKNKIKTDLENLQKVAQILVQQLLLKELHVIVNCVEKAENINNLKRSVFAVILLGRMNPLFCELMTKLGVVRSLLAVCVEKKWQEMHPCVLRALTVLTCSPAAIRSFEESGGVDCICDVLCDSGSQEGARSEAAGLVAQITAPWTEGSGYVLRSVTKNSDRLVKSIARLASSTDNSEVFLLTSAALANLSFADDALKKMKTHEVLQILVAACRNKSHAASLFIKDQVATVMANMAAKDEYRQDLSSGGSLMLLLGFLQLGPSPGQPQPQLAACERVQQKAAIALARLCTDPTTSNIVAKMQGIQRLIKLCKDRKERNDSDSVLVACLAALRKIAAVREKEEFTKLGAQELIEPRLWDAFLAHSSKRESYV
ncbi:hypothetical protein JTE90_001275 [Oedothorax gibbosus]|uniref:Protein inscuteable homologue C-terminal domain-containing protein n=1 Tax=Oedothorax gibbosus TaxID=931172 RepID=A0AAV6V4W5_9ARAC|nr:hypothetical protein JTE90_001275 [Oedothorax gibbosus]